MATTKKSKSKNTLGAIYEKTKDVVGDILMGAATGAVVGAAGSAVKTVVGGKATLVKAAPSGGKKSPPKKTASKSKTTAKANVSKPSTTKGNAKSVTKKPVKAKVAK